MFIFRDNFQSWHCAVPKLMRTARLDPSCAVGFYCRTRGELSDLLDRLPSLFTPVRTSPMCSTLVEVVNTSVGLTSKPTWIVPLFDNFLSSLLSFCLVAAFGSRADQLFTNYSWYCDLVIYRSLVITFLHCFSTYWFLFYPTQSRSLPNYGEVYRCFAPFHLIKCIYMRPWVYNHTDIHSDTLLWIQLFYVVPELLTNSLNVRIVIFFTFWGARSNIVHTQLKSHGQFKRSSR